MAVRTSATVRVSTLCPLVQIVQRQVVPGDVGGVASSLRLLSMRSAKPPIRVVFGGAQFGLGGAFGHKAGQHFARDLHGAAWSGASAGQR